MNSLSFGTDGRSSDPLRIASGKYLLDLDRCQVLRMEIRSVVGKECLFVESGGFSERNQPGWSTSWLAFGRK